MLAKKCTSSARDVKDARFYTYSTLVYFYAARKTNEKINLLYHEVQHASRLVEMISEMVGDGGDGGGGG